MQSYWVNFAKTADPNGPGLPMRPVFKAPSQQAMFLDEHAADQAELNLELNLL